MRIPDINAGTISVDPVDATALFATVSEAAQVRRRYQFYVWSQAALRSLIPHGLLVCGLPRAGSGRMFFDYFYNVPVLPDTLSRLCHPRTGLAAEMLDFWLNGGCEPIVFGRGQVSVEQGKLNDELSALGLGHSLVHGIPSAQSAVGAHGFFGLIAMPEPPSIRDVTLMQLLVPHLFGAYCRALTKDRSTDSPLAADGNDLTITDREVEILCWVREGKSNQEIGMILSISPLTVKNHVQKILRKLQATNRAQAVSKAIALKLLNNIPQRTRLDAALGDANG